MSSSNSENGYNKSVRQRVFALLTEYPWLTAKNICERLNLPYEQYCSYVNNLRNSWKSNFGNEQGSKCSSVHGWRGWCCVPFGARRDLAVSVGWVLSRARNRFLVWRDALGRMEWFETGRVNLYVRKPANLGRVKQLISNGLFKTSLIADVGLLEQVMVTVHLREEHYVFETGHPLPKATIDRFRNSHGMIVKVGDGSHPQAVEVISRVPDWTERFTLFLERLESLLNSSVQEKDFSKKSDYVV